MKRIDFNKSDQQGFTLVEVMIALAIFAVFIAAYMTSQGTNIASSSRFKEEINMRNLAEIKINEIIVSPPPLEKSLELTPDTGAIEDAEGYTYSITYKSFLIPDLTKIQGGADQQEEGQMVELEKRMFQTIKDNFEMLLWQVEVEITNSITGDKYRATTWIYNPKAQVRFNVI